MGEVDKAHSRNWREVTSMDSCHRSHACMMTRSKVMMKSLITGQIMSYSEVHCTLLHAPQKRASDLRIE
jgi:hypothetical protein